MKLKTKFNKILKDKGYEFRRFTEPEFRWIKNYKVNTVLDIGANTGQFAINVARYNPSLKIYSFEPIKKCYESLVECTKHLDIQCFNCALGEKDEIQNINVHNHTPSSSLLTMADLHIKNFEYTKDYITEEIKIKTLDQLYNQLDVKKEVLIKIDVQGYEDKVLKGGINSIQQAKILLIEVSYKTLYLGQPLFDDIYNQLIKMGFIYMGNLEQTKDNIDDLPLYANAFFLKSK